MVTLIFNRKLFFVTGSQLVVDSLQEFPKYIPSFALSKRIFGGLSPRGEPIDKGGVTKVLLLLRGPASRLTGSITTRFLVRIGPKIKKACSF